jgi:predicted class III extradiol MEMO1 family dioxygenase
MRSEPKNARIRPPAVAGLFYPRDAAEQREAAASLCWCRWSLRERRPSLSV